MMLAAAILLTRTVASELSARVTASMFASSSLPIFSKKRSVSKCLGVSSSTITVGPFLTFVVKLCLYVCVTARFV